MQMYHRTNGMTIEYTIETDPPEALYWTTYRLKKSEIKILTDLDRSTATQIRQEIFDDIIERESNPSKKSPSSNDSLPKRRKSPKPVYVETRQTKQKAG